MQPPPRRLACSGAVTRFLCRVVPGHVTGVLVAKSHTVREIVPDEISREGDRSLRFVRRLPDAEQGDPSVVELADLVADEARLRLEDRPEPGPGDLDDLVGRTRRHVVHRNPEMAPRLASLSLRGGVPAP